jgi:hypothetical protein
MAIDLETEDDIVVRSRTLQDSEDSNEQYPTETTEDIVEDIEKHAHIVC